MADANTDAIVQLIDAAQAELAQRARAMFASEGRGFLLVKFPPLPPPGRTAIAVADVVYHRLAELKRLATGMDDGDVLIKMVETYDPTTQAVVMAAIGRGNPVSLKMKLDPPMFVEGPDGVQ